MYKYTFVQISVCETAISGGDTVKLVSSVPFGV